MHSWALIIELGLHLWLASSAAPIAMVRSWIVESTSKSVIFISDLVATALSPFLVWTDTDSGSLPLRSDMSCPHKSVSAAATKQRKSLWEGFNLVSSVYSAPFPL